MRLVARAAMMFVALLAFARLFVSCPEPVESPEPMTVAACGPVEDAVDLAYFQIGASVIPSGLMSSYSAWFLGATRPDCSADLELSIEPMEGTDLDIPAGLLTAQVAVMCFNPPSRNMTYDLPLVQIGSRSLKATYHITDVPSCMDDEHRAAAAYFGQPFSPVTIQVRVTKNPAAAEPKLPHLLAATTTFRHSSFESWRSVLDAGDAGDASDGGNKLVRITKPADGAVVQNPVTFTVAAAAEVASVKLVADGKFNLGVPFDPAVQRDLTQTFGTLGRRVIRAIGFDARGKEIGSDSITIWVIKELVVAQTYFYVAQESDYAGGVGTWTFPGKGCTTLSVDGGGPILLPTSFFNGACIEGTAKLTGGQLFNYAGDCPQCAQTNNTCPQLGDAGPRTKCWEELDAIAYPWGKGASTRCPRDAGMGSCPLVPLVSWATDPTVIEFGTTLYARDWDGKVLPSAGGVAGATLDGCFRADDTGSKIKGTHVDIFAGSKAMQKALEGIFPSVPDPYAPWMRVELHHKKCDYLKAGP